MELYHGTSLANAKKIMKSGFNDRVKANEKNWDGKYLSKKGFT